MRESVKSCHVNPVHFFFFYKQLVYKQPQAQIAKNLSTLLSTLSASVLVEKSKFVHKIVALYKKYGKICQDYANLPINSLDYLLNPYSNYIKLKIISN